MEQTRTGRQLPPARRERRDLTAQTVAGAVWVITIALWLIGGGPAQLGDPAGGWLVLGQLSGQLAALASWAGLVLVARPGWVESRHGLDTLWVWHRWLGIATAFALLVHTVASSVGFAGGDLLGAVGEVIALMGSTTWMVAAVVSGALFFIVALTSWRRIKRHMTYETWLGVHLTGYLAVLLAFGHTLTLGASTSGANHTLMKTWWIALFAATVVIVVWARVGGLVRAVVFQRGRITRVYPAAGGSAAIEVRVPRRLAERTKAGQFFLLRFATKDLWWQAHPMSISTNPTAISASHGMLRFTVNLAAGDGSRTMAQLPPGTGVVLEGPYGRLTAERAQGRPAVLIGGGVGLAPLRSLLADPALAPDPVLVARVRHRDLLPHSDELRQLAQRRGGRMLVVDGPRQRWNRGEPFAAGILLQAIPDLRSRAVFVCGPGSLQRSVLRGLREAGVPADQIHIERFEVS